MAGTNWKPPSMSSLSDEVLRERAAVVLYWDEKGQWPGEGEIPTWVRECYHDTRQAIKLATDAVKHEVLRRYVCGC